ncbi:unnamed protein product [Sphagnum jensenii]|uniref:Serine aminopeptidase S33 domain-containing protein n=1 Tax=Sphagnum jensenii TaxID=128206 RepID=A0ABP0X3E3_9BRYO
MEQLVNFVIRPPRANYSPSSDLLEQEFLLKGKKYVRKDLQVINGRGHVLQCSHYMPHTISEDLPLPCVIYCHGNSGCRADANEAAIILLPSNITVFTLDFSGSGLSDGNYVSLGWNEMDDLQAAVNYLRTQKLISRIGLWGRSMGAVTRQVSCLRYGAQDPSIAGMVLDSPFSNLNDLMMELVDVYKIRLPKFTVKVAVQYMRKLIQKRAQFDIMDLDSVQMAANSFIPALIGHGTEDIFIQPHHSDLIYKSYAGDKNIIKFEGDHNSPRPQFYYDSITIFFYNVLRPPDEPMTVETIPEHVYFDDSLDLGSDIDEDVLYAIMGAVRPPRPNMCTGSLSADGPSSDGQGTESTEEALTQTRSRWQMSRTVVKHEHSSEKDKNAGSSKFDCVNGHADCWDASLSNGASLGSSGQVSPSNDDKFADFPSNPDDEERMVMEAIAASLHDVDIKESEVKDQEQLESDGSNSPANSSRLDAFSQRLRLSLFRGSRRHGSR